jgi:ankyrin repeat protein
MKKQFFGILLVCCLLLMQGVRANEIDIFEAAKHGKVEIVKRILEADPELVNAVDGGMQATALHWALIYGKKDVIKVILSYDPDVNREEAHQGTTLHWAAHFDDAEHIEWLLDRGAEIDHVNQYGRTPLLVAARRGCIKVTDVLLKHGADIHAKLGDGSTALHIAARNGHNQIIEFLIGKGLDPEIKNADGDTYKDVLFTRPKSIKSDGSDYAQFAGLYENQGGLDLDFRQEDNRLYYYAYGKDELLPIAKDRFITHAEVKYFEFVKDEEGAVTEVIYSLGSRDIRAKKIK